MRKDHEDEIWEAEAAVAYSQAAESEFTRLKHSLKVKAGLIKEPVHQRVLRRLQGIVERIKAFLGRH